LILQNFTHRGTVSASGFLFSAKLLPENEMRRRILAVWHPNAKVFRWRENLILLFSQSFRVDCRRADGLPLVRYGEILSSFPLEKNDLERFRDLGETIVLANEGKIQTLFLRDLEAENIEKWFDVSGFEIVETETLGEVKTKPVVIEKVEEIDLRSELKDVPQADAEMSEILQILKRKKDEITKAKSNQTVQGGSFSASSQNIFGSFFDSLKSLFSSKSEQDWQNSYESAPNPPGKLRKMFTKALFQMKIAQILGRKQAQYLAKMMEMFESGDLDEALKYAIPLEDMQSLKEMSEQMPFLGFLRPRENLQINYGRQNSSNSSVFLENQWFDDLRGLYRQTFDRLVAQKRIEEAAFVLAELLKSHHEAVEFLEKHGKYRLAAELAESRGLSTEIIVRQWFLAGEKRRAIRLTVLHNCFEYVVTKMEKENHPQAAELREIWAESLAASGNFPAAVNTIWKLENKRELAANWIDKVIEFGGTTAAEMLAKKITLFPKTFEEIKEKLLEILAENGTEAEENRAAFARETLRLVPNAELRVLIRPLARKILADMARDKRRFSPQNLRQLVEISKDYALRTDLPKFTENADKQTSEIFKLEINERDQGAVRVFDACLLPDGKIAVALGEAGVKILSKQGKTIAHFDQPAQKLVVSNFGTKAICLARRGEVWRLAKIDFVERKSVYWCDAVIENFAPTFDGNLWFIAEKDEIYAIDANAENFEAVWRVPEIGGQVYEIECSKGKLMLLIFNEKGFEKWWYDLPQLVLRSRNEQKWIAMENEDQSIHSVGSSIAHSVVQIVETVENQTKFRIKIFDYNVKMTEFELAGETLAAGKPLIFEKTFALSSVTENGVKISLYAVPESQIAEFNFLQSENCSLKLDEKFLVITDEFGRVIIFDHKEKILRRNLRV
jgi:hypothetical protein